MRRLALALSLTLLAAPALAKDPPPPPSPPLPSPSLQPAGRDQVLIGRIYWRQAGQTQPVARFGMVLSGKDTSQAIPFDGSAVGAGRGTVALTARRKGGDEAIVDWTVQPGSGSVAAGSGNASVREGGVGHAPLGGSADGGELFASFETGRASSFNTQRIWEHFGIVTERQRFQPRDHRDEPAWAPPAGSAAAPATPPATPRGGSIQVTCAGGGRFELSTGTGSGACSVDVAGDSVRGGSCDDGAGNMASASCTVNAGAGSCVSSSGSGSCRSLR